MGPPIGVWPCCGNPRIPEIELRENSDNATVYRRDRRRSNILCVLSASTELWLNITVIILLVHLFMCFHSVNAGPVVLNLDYFQGPTPVARNIRHLPCISRKTGKEGLCMFAIDCMKGNGTHLGTCIDRFYFGSCCQIPDKTILPQIIGNNIDDNSIDDANFVHPLTEDYFTKTSSKAPEIISSTQITTTEKNVKETVTTERTESEDHTTVTVTETKYVEQSISDNKIPDNDVKLTTAVAVETTAKNPPNTETMSPVDVTDIPVKLSTFQSVSGITDKLSTEIPLKEDTTELPNATTVLSSSSSTVVTYPSSSKPSIKPIPQKKPTYKPRPTLKPTRPLTVSTFKPKPPISLYNVTRLPYHPPPKRPSTKKPLPIPPRLNITILPQSTSSKPVFTRPSLSSITYINTTASLNPDSYSSTIGLLTTPSPVVSSTISTAMTENVSISTEKPIETSEFTTETKLVEITPKPILTTESSEKITDKPDYSSNTVLTTSYVESAPLTTLPQDNTVTEVTETKLDSVTTPSSQETTILSTEFPPLVTWSSTVDTATKLPDKSTSNSDELWSPITPPEGWVLISTVQPKPEGAITSTPAAVSTLKPLEANTSTAPLETTPTLPETTLQIMESSSNITSQQSISSISTSILTSTTTEAPTSLITSPMTSTESTITSSTTQSTTLTSTTETQILEFTVNVTLSPTAPTSTTSMGLTTFSSVTTDNDTEIEVVYSNDTASTSFSNVTDTFSTELPTTSASLNVTEPETITSTTLQPLNMSDYKDVCGRRLWPQSRIVGGSKADFGRWPWQISLRQWRTSTYLHKCGAALLNENWAITAAHCVEHVPPSELLIRLGEHDLANEDEPYGFAERRIQLVASHPHFDPATFEYDLALLRFIEPVNFQPNILPVCVPDDDENFVGKTAFVTGWGRLYDEGPLPSVLQEVQVPVINNTACEAMYRAAGYNEHIPNIFICAGKKYGGADSCEGDSGGPMVVQRERDGRFVLSGIISWGIGCAEPNQPGVYTRISEFRDWINQILQF